MQASLAPQLQAASISFAPLIPDDPLSYLPCSPIGEYGEGQAIYEYYEPAERLYLVVAGKVKISRQANGPEVVLDVYQSDELFGESALSGLSYRMEMAVALENTKAMSWSREEIEDITASSPKLAMALLQLVVRRSADFGTRIESLSAESIPQRLMRTLLRFAERFGSETEDGTVKMGALTHELLSQYVGTSREIVTHHMSLFRRAGYLQYSRDDISLHKRAFVEWQPGQQTAAFGQRVRKAVA